MSLKDSRPKELAEDVDKELGKILGRLFYRSTIASVELLEQKLTQAMNEMNEACMKRVKQLALGKEAEFLSRAIGELKIQEKK